MFNNGVVQLWEYSESERLYVVSIKISGQKQRNQAKKLNAFLKAYLEPIKFQDFEEPCFKFKASQVEYIDSLLDFRGVFSTLVRSRG